MGLVMYRHSMDHVMNTIALGSHAYISVKPLTAMLQLINVIQYAENSVNNINMC